MAEWILVLITVHGLTTLDKAYPTEAACQIALQNVGLESPANAMRAATELEPSSPMGGFCVAGRMAS